MFKDQLKKAKENRFALGQFNFCTLEQLQGIMIASKETLTPVICGTSGGEVDFIGLQEAASLVKIMREKMGVSVFLNLDHGRDVDLVKKAIDFGYDGVHFDGSNLSFEENILTTKEVVDYARERGVVVEGEVGRIEGASVVHESQAEKPILTSMEKIVKFADETGVDSIALDVGSLHGIYSNAPVIEFERINEAAEKTGCFIVLHGGSGIPEEDIRECIKRGVVKININTELRIAWRNAIYEKMSKDDDVVPYKILPCAREATTEKVKKLIKLFNYEKDNF